MTKDEALKMAIEAMSLPNNLSFLMAITACKDALEQEERTQRTMHCGTADAFIAMDDDHKRRWFVQSLRESKRRKELEDILEQTAQEIVCKVFDIDNFHSSVLDRIKLEQPLTRDWKETIDERIAKDDEFKQALEQPAQEPVAWISVKDRLPPVNIEVLTYDKHHEKQYFLTSIIIENVDKFYFNAFTHWMPLPSAPNETNTNPAPSWQGLSEDKMRKMWLETDNISWIAYKENYRAIEQALKEKNL